MYNVISFAPFELFKNLIEKSSLDCFWLGIFFGRVNGQIFRMGSPVFGASNFMTLCQNGANVMLEKVRQE